MAKQVETIAKSLLDRTRTNDPRVRAAYDQVKAEQRAKSKQAELEELMKRLQAIEASLIAARREPKARIDSLKRQKREAEGAIKTWQYLNGFG